MTQWKKYIRTPVVLLEYQTQYPAEQFLVTLHGLDQVNDLLMKSEPRFQLKEEPGEEERAVRKLSGPRRRPPGVRGMRIYLIVNVARAGSTFFCCHVVIHAAQQPRGDSGVAGANRAWL